MTKQEVFNEAYTEAAKRRDEKEAYVNRLYDTMSAMTTDPEGIVALNDWFYDERHEINAEMWSTIFDRVGNEPDWGAEYQVYADTRRAIFNNPEEY